MLYQFEFRPYRRQFKRALSTSHGNWDIREGIILRFTDDKGAIGWGEIAPIPWFGSETLPSAINFCRQLGDEITTETIFSIPSKLPSCQFGFESALNFGFWILDFGLKADFPNSVESATNPQSKIQNLKSKIAYSCLLPAGEAALHQWQTLWQQGYRTFKWKINVVPIQDEIKIFAKLIQALPTSAKLRLDANAGLNWSAANEWLKVCENYSQIEFLEQP
ncbi:o-succinylbenzoate synthase, partial [Planktothrix sp. FACHB-1355]